MDYQAIIIAILGGSALTKMIDLMSSTSPRLRMARKEILKLEELVEAWHQHWIRVNRWLNAHDIETTNIPPPPEEDDE